MEGIVFIFQVLWVMYWRFLVWKVTACIKVGAADFYILNCGVYQQNMYVDNDDSGDVYSPIPLT